MSVRRGVLVQAVVPKEIAKKLAAYAKREHMKGATVVRRVLVQFFEGEIEDLEHQKRRISNLELRVKILERKIVGTARRLPMAR